MSLKVVSLSKRFKDKWALRDVSFDVLDGEVFGIFGPSGSGKSTLLQTIRGDLKANGGEIFSGDRKITGKHNFATVEPPRESIWRRFSGAQNKNHHDPTGDSLLRALESAKSVLLLDDPLAGLDAPILEDVVAKIRNAALARGLSIVIASGNFEHILRASDRVAVLVDGEVKQVGAPQEIYERPDCRAVASIVGRNNLFAARRLTSSKAEIPEFHTIDGGHRLFAQRIDRGGLGALNQNVTLAIRPEQISISFGASFPEDNLLKATVTGIKFLGPTTMIELDADGLTLEVLVLRVVGLNVGDECMVGLPPDRIQIFKD